VGVIAIHPGEHLAEELEIIGISAAELARNLDVPTNRVTQILNGQRAITGDTALRLAHYFGTTPEFWLNLQSIYDLRLAQQKSGSAIRRLPTTRASGRAPRKSYELNEMVKSISKTNLHPETDFGPPQGKELSGGVRRTR
jgi:addiction module HigA family antidote